MTKLIHRSYKTISIAWCKDKNIYLLKEKRHIHDATYQNDVIYEWGHELPRTSETVHYHASLHHALQNKVTVHYHESLHHAYALWPCITTNHCTTPSHLYLTRATYIHLMFFFLFLLFCFLFSLFIFWGEGSGNGPCMTTHPAAEPQDHERPRILDRHKQRHSRNPIHN